MLKDWLKRRTGRLWPWIALPVRAGRHVGRSVLELPRTLRWGRVRATLHFASACRRELAVDRGRLTVAVDVNPYWEKLTGVGWYLHQILTHLAADDSIRLYLYGPTLFLAAGDPAPAVALPQGPALRRMAVVVPETVLFPRLLVRALRRLEPWIVARQGHDVVFAPNFLVPQKLGRCPGALVVTVHDLGVRRVAWSLDDRTRKALDSGLEASLARAAAVITPSQAVGQEVVAAGLASAEVVAPIHHGPGQLGKARGAPLPVRVPRRYVLFVGTLEPRKNLELVLEAWSALRGERSDWPPLVVCGGWGWKSERVRERVEIAGREGWLVHLGYVDDAALAALYRGALFLVFPSLYEGFGLPLLEALAAGCPVVCSDLPVFREVAGAAAEYAPAADAASWLEPLRRLHADHDRRVELARLGVARAAQFSWERAARETLEVLRSASGRIGTEGSAGKGAATRRSAA
ncbi:MAG TPA: glycosyltransferase family 1 protein [Thermoanaerobaculia bacterium]|nr:glycosyltransferase family 1 protein [Thermoanaerobaculia bacterium]